MATAGDDIPGKSDGCTSEDLVDEPLDKRKIEVTKDGRKIVVPAINIGFMEKRHFVHYKPLVSFNITKSENETLTAAEEEWLERISFLEDDLHWLLKLSHQRFWSQVVFDEGLQQCLESFLTFAPREYDLRENGREDLFSVLRKVHKLVFFVFLRMSTYKESKMDHMTSSGFGTIIYDNFLFDIPKMMDLCALYGSQNKVLLMKMISNIFDVQPKYSSDLVAVVPNLFSVFDNVEMKLGLHSTSEEENQRPIKLGEERIPCISSMSLPSLLDIAHYIMDSSVTLNSFLEVYLPGCSILFKYGFTTRIASFYNRVFPAIERELKARTRKQEETFQIIEEMRLKLGLAKTHWIRMFRNFISSSCLQPIIESRCESINGISASQSSHLEELMKIFTEVVSEKYFIRDYNSLFPFDSDVEILSEADISLDPTRLDYIFNGIHQNEEDAIDKNCNLMPSNSTSDSMSKSSMQNGLKTEAITNLQGLASALADMKPVASNRDSNFQNYGDTASAACPLSDLQMNSLIKTVLDLLPDYGPGFIEECLKCYEFSSEKVIDALLQNNLPENLKMLDPTLQRKIITNNIDSSSNYIPPTLLSERRNVFDYDEFDVFNREDVNMEKIHQGKRDKTPQEYEGLSNGKNADLSFLKEAALNYSAESNFCDEELGLYDDEYDDTYDSVMIGIDEKQTEKELQSLRPFTTPRVLEQWKRQEREVEEVPHVGGEEGDEKILPPKRDEFVPNPEILRERAEQKRQEKIAARGRHHPSRNLGNASGGNGNQTQNRQQKEKHKSRIANHSRRNQSDWKKSRGMVPFPTR